MLKNHHNAVNDGNIPPISAGWFLTEAKTKEEMLQVIFLRRKVLVSENRYSILKSEPDKYDLTSKIYVAKQGNKVIGTARVRKEGNIYRIQRMAVCKNYRKKGMGIRIIKKILKDFINKRIYLMSPKSSVSFYEQFGFKNVRIFHPVFDWWQKANLFVCGKF